MKLLENPPRRSLKIKLNIKGIVKGEGWEAGGRGWRTEKSGRG